MFSSMMIAAVALGDGNENRWEHGNQAYDHARQAVETGEILPMSQLLERLESHITGDVVGVEFQQEDGVWVYEFKVIDTRGRLLEVYLNPQSGELLSVEED